MLSMSGRVSGHTQPLLKLSMDPIKSGSLHSVTTPKVDLHENMSHPLGATRKPPMFQI